MKKEEIEALKKTFPWSYSAYTDQGAYMLRIVDKNGREVDLAQLVRFVCYVTRLMSNHGKATSDAND